MTVTIRAATPEEDGLIAQQFYQMWLDNGLAVEVMKPDWDAITRDYLQQARRELGYQAFVAEVEGKIVGSAGGQRFAGPYPITFTASFRVDGYIWGVYVEADYRKRGIGKRLTQRVVDHLKHMGCTRVVLNASPSGKSVYEQLGFQPSNSMVLNL